MVLIHYGDDRYRPDSFVPIKNKAFIKPIGGLWASPKGSQFGWKPWCESEDFHVERLKDSFIFQLDKKAKICTIDSLNDLMNLPTQNLLDADGYTRITLRRSLETDLLFNRFIPLDFEKIAKKYDAIYLTWKGQCETRYSISVSLYGWDCESVLILKPKHIHEL